MAPSKSDFNALADAICNTPMPQATKDELVDRFIVYFAQVNPRFDDVRFRDAAGATP
jgi:hypothetical protein